MNCEQCGAPMSVEKDGDFFHCKYCGDYAFPDPNKDGVALLDEVSSYACPVCKKLLVTASIGNIRIFSCPNCRGNLIDQSKMLSILRQAVHPNHLDEEQVFRPDRSELGRKLVCPSCRKTMSTYPYGGPGNLIIQGCDRCRLIWLDFGELSRIIQAYMQMYDCSPDELGEKKKRIEF